jgi:hypothetical protein
LVSVAIVVDDMPADRAEMGKAVPAAADEQPKPRARERVTGL